MKKDILLFIIVFYLIFGLFFLYLNNKKNNYSREDVEELLASVSSYRDETVDMCQRGIFGDPKNVGDNYIKLEFDCGDRKILSTMALVNLDDLSLESVINEYLRIINFDKNKWSRDDWLCKIGEREIDLSYIVGKTNTILCKKI